MFIGLEYVVATYVIWLATFFVYIFLTKYRLKKTDHSISALERRVSGLSSDIEGANDI